MVRLLLTLGIIFISLAAGYAYRLALLRRLAPAPTAAQPVPGLNPAMEKLAVVRRRMQSLALFVCMPLAALLSLWGLPSPDPRLLALPLLGLDSWVLGGALAVLFAFCLSLDRRQTGSLYCCGTFTNIGAVGSLVCVIFLGEGTIALTALYRLCEEIFFFSVAYPVSRWYGQSTAGGPGARFSLRSLRLEPVLLVVVCALCLGVVLNILGPPRPEALGHLASFLTTAATTLFLFAIGVGLRPSRLTCYTRQWLAVAAIKFLCLPVLITGLAWAVGLGQVDNGLPLRVVAVLSCMPVAMNALIPPSLFNLDLDLANACWTFTTLALVLVLPLLLWILHYL